MSERMIELQRARLLAAGKGNRSAAGANGANTGGPAAGSGTGQTTNGSAQAQQTPQQKAAAAVRTEDEQLDHFLQRLAYFRDDSREASARGGPTVPTALSRRLLHRQGAGFLDPTVAAMASAAADRFLSTVLHQAVACRDQRLKGQEAQREARIARKRHLDLVQADRDDRERRKAEKIAKREATNLEAIAAAEALDQKGGPANKDATGDDGVPSPKSKKGKKKPAEPINGASKSAATLRSRLNHVHAEDDEDSVDSMDEEENYYRSYYGDENTIDDNFNGEEEEDDEALIVRDLHHPLQAWGFDMTGKLGMDPSLSAKNEKTNDDDAVDRGGDALALDHIGGEVDAEDDEEPESDEDEDMVDALGPSSTSAANRKSAATPVPPDGEKKKATNSPAVAAAAVRNSPAPS